MRYEEQEYCYECQKQEQSYEQGKNIWLHKYPVSAAVYQFKYHNRRVYGEFFAGEMYRLFAKDIKRWQIDVIVPIPLHRKRRRRRGFNQAELVAKELGRMAGISVNTKLIRRKKYTKPQKELNAKERKENMKNAFTVSDKSCKGRSILLIDDIYTTGSTINAAAAALKGQMECNVWFLTISIGQDF